jgi:hypothetical protein
MMTIEPTRDHRHVVPLLTVPAPDEANAEALVLETSHLHVSSTVSGRPLSGEDPESVSIHQIIDFARRIVEPKEEDDENIIGCILVLLHGGRVQVLAPGAYLVESSELRGDIDE